MKVLVDGVFYQLTQSGIGRVWTSLLGQLAADTGLELVMLDRGGAPDLAGVRRVAFPSYTDTYTAADSLLIQEFCDRLGVDVFTSTYYTTATTTPQVQVIYDMIPEVLGFDLSARIWKEKALAVHYASDVACISENTRADLVRLYPELEPDRVAVMHCGVDTDIFGPAGSKGLPKLRATYGLARPYYLLVGSREQHMGYKNGKLLFDAARIDKGADYDIVCVGGERTVDASWALHLPAGVRVHLLRLSDAELASAYSGAAALVYPSLYEGFGLPVIEAMACGCPVITTRYGSLPEVAGDAAAFVTGHDPRELLQAMKRVRSPGARAAASRAGQARARDFTWGRAADGFRALLSRAASEAGDADVQDFHRQWRQLRTIQADVDVGID